MFWLSGEGMSNRAIAEVVSSSEPTVRRDLASASNDAVEDPAPTLTGLNGKTYQRNPTPSPAREPIPDTEELDRLPPREQVSDFYNLKVKQTWQ